MEINKQIQQIPQIREATLLEALNKWKQYWLELCDQIEAERACIKHDVLTRQN